jgi:hypothetical protein
MVVRPNSDTYGDLLRLAADGSSYDGPSHVAIVRIALTRPQVPTKGF